MAIPAGQARPGASALRNASWYDPSLRVGDAERSEVADLLAKHYSDGRLDHAEFSERLDQAMKAKTISELTGLLADLPGSAQVTASNTEGGRRHRRRMLRMELERQRMQLRHERRQHRAAERQQRMHALRWIPMLIAVLILAAFVMHALTHSVGAWIVIGLVALFWVYRSTGGYRGS
jgi:Domain of unknown function (DUF1707)